MSQISRKKDSLLSDLWLPIVKGAASDFYPRSKNKKMKLLTLTNADNIKEIRELVSEKITEKELVYSWNHDNLKMIRLDCEGFGTVLGPSRYEDSIISNTHEIHDQFPFSILNLDFCSQDPILQSCRFEKEIMSLDKTLSLQHSKNNHNFVLLYTTVVNGETVNCETLKQNSTLIRVEGWSGLSLLENGIILDPNKKIEVLEIITKQLASKYGYDIEVNKKVCEVEIGTRSICSLACIFRKRKIEN